MKILLILLLLIGTAAGEYDCLDYALASEEPVILIGKHSFFYGSVDSETNHYMNYEIIDNVTIRLIDHKTNASVLMSTKGWEEIRPGVFYDGFNYFKQFIHRAPQRYWRKMV